MRGAGGANALADPTLELHEVNGTLLRANDHWKETQQGEVAATSLAPQQDLESAVVASLAMGTTRPTSAAEETPRVSG